MGTAASEPRCRCVYLHHGLDPLLGPPHGRTWQRSATGSGLRLVSCSLRCTSSPGTIAHGCCPARQKRRVVIVPSWRGDLAVAISGIVRLGLVRLSVAAGRNQRNTRAVRDGRNEGRSLSSTLVGLPGWIARSLYLLAHHTAERPKERGVCRKFRA